MSQRRIATVGNAFGRSCIYHASVLTLIEKF